MNVVTEKPQKIVMTVTCVDPFLVTFLLVDPAQSSFEQMEGEFDKRIAKKLDLQVGDEVEMTTVTSFRKLTPKKLTKEKVEEINNKVNKVFGETP